MKPSDQELNLLIERLIVGDASPEEEKCVLDLVDSDPAVAEVFRRKLIAETLVEYLAREAVDSVGVSRRVRENPLLDALHLADSLPSGSSKAVVEQLIAADAEAMEKFLRSIERRNARLDSGAEDDSEDMDPGIAEVTSEEAAPEEPRKKGDEDWDFIEADSADWWK